MLNRIRIFNHKMKTNMNILTLGDKPIKLLSASNVESIIYPHYQSIFGTSIL